jgi:hypothetical protein
MDKDMTHHASLQPSHLIAGETAIVFHQMKPFTNTSEDLR